MSYNSRVYRHRNLHSHDGPSKEPFFVKQNDVNKSLQKGSFFQAKLTVNAEGDQYEKEADHVASKVVNSQNANPVYNGKTGGIQKQSTALPENEKKEKQIHRMVSEPEKKKLKEVQKMGEPEKEKKDPIQKMGEPEKEKKDPIQKMGEPEKEEEKKTHSSLQKKSEGATNVAPAKVSSAIEHSAGKGEALAPNVRSEMSHSFGVDFSDVRIHKDGEAAGLNKQLEAQAFTHGSDIYFNEGKYNPESASGKFLLAHELTHVVQQEDNIRQKTIQRRVIEKNVVTNDAIETTVGLSRDDIVAAITAGDQDAIILAQNAEDTLTAQLDIVNGGGVADADAELILNEELGLSFNNRSQHGLIRQQISRFKRVRETLESGYLRYLALGIGNVQLVGCSAGNCTASFAFSCPGNRLIVLCQPFYDNTDQQSATILHEPFHIWFLMARHDTGALRRADASCFESYALRASGRSAFASCNTHTGG